MHILALDPGQHTGWCLLQNKDKRIEPVKAGVVEGFAPMCSRLQQLLLLWPDMVVCESFMLLPYMSTEVSAHDPHMSSSQLQGVVRFLVPEARLVLQQPSLKNSVPDEELRKLGLWRWKEAVYETSVADTGKLAKHMHDAMRHAVLYIWRNEK